MPIYAVNQDGLLVNALDCGDCVHNTYFCHECNKQLERNISFVAFTRHKKSLTVLC